MPFYHYDTLGDTDYGDTPWPSITAEFADYWSPVLMPAYRQRSYFYGLVSFRYEPGQQRSGTVHYTQRIAGPPNIAPLDVRQMWLPQIYTDTKSISITCARYGDKIMVHRYDDRMSQWREGNIQGLLAIARSDLAPHMMESLDLLARNAFLRSHFYGFAGNATGFHDLDANDTLSIGEVFRAQNLSGEYSPLGRSNIACLTTPGIIYQIRSSQPGDEWYERVALAQPELLINGQVGTYEGIPVASVPNLTLYNCGPILAQTTITAAVEIGAGAADPETEKVDGVWSVGLRNVMHYIQVADASDFAAGDLVTLHRVRATANGPRSVQNGVVWDSPYNLLARVYSVDAANNRLVLAEPVMVDWFSSQIQTNVYGYVTKARPVHATLFIKGPEAVVAGVIDPPRFYEPQPIDDTLSIFRFSWDAYMGFQPFFTERIYVVYSAAPIVNGNQQVVNL